uniref:Hexosyltransferase n=1 Tax=Crassostrea virginica TaxID=6565 RepID=A0A8B8BVF6_CRAVI|nr:beta-1,3-galactosyltransferase 5-like [Crassostrea virginica]
MNVITLILKRGGRGLLRRKMVTYVMGVTICVVLLLNLMRYIQNEFNTKTDYETIKFINKKHLGYHEIDYLPSAISCHNNGTTTFLLICIPSATGNFKQRLAIRNSWGSAVKRNPSLTLTFFVEKSKNKETENIVRKEKQIFMDIIEVDVEARYENLAKKSIMILEWALFHCKDAKYMLKVDDDVFLNIGLLKADLISENYSNSIIGCKVRNSSPFRFPLSKWYLSRDQYSADIFPDYISGPAYVLSGDIFFKLYSATKLVPRIFLEDVYLNGICREKVSVKAVGHPGFSCGFRDEGPCGGFFRYKITGHHYFPDEIKRMWLELRDRWFTCPFKHSYVVSKFFDILHFVV